MNQIKNVHEFSLVVVYYSQIDFNMYGFSMVLRISVRINEAEGNSPIPRGIGQERVR